MLAFSGYRIQTFFVEFSGQLMLKQAYNHVKTLVEKRRVAFNQSTFVREHQVEEDENLAYACVQRPSESDNPIAFVSHTPQKDTSTDYQFFEKLCQALTRMLL